MKALRRVLLGVALGAGGLVAWSGPAAACSCAATGGPPPVEFEGTAVEQVARGTLGQLWAFDVARVVRGDVARRVVADVDAQQDPGPDGIVVQSSCSLAVRLTAGATYEVAGYVGEAPGGEPRIFVNTCGGSVRQLDAAPPTSTPTPAERTVDAAVPVTEPAGPPAGWVWGIAGAGTAALGVAALLVVRARRAGSAP